MAQAETQRGTRKRRPRPMTLQTLSKVLTTSIVRLEDDLLASTDADEARKIAHALATITGAYRGLMESTELLERIERLETEARNAAGYPTPAARAA